MADDITLTNITQITNRAYSDLSGKPSLAELVLPWADANVADNITLTNLTQITTRNYSDLAGLPSLAVCNVPWVDANVANDLTIASTSDGNFTKNLGVDGNFYVKSGAYFDNNVHAARYCFGANCAMWIDYNTEAMIFGG